MDDLMARIKAEGWHMTLDYVPSINIFICQLTGKRVGWGRSELLESAVIDAIREMDR